jgi:hypothetical protein
MLAHLNRRRTGALCLGIAVAFLVLGWWPFDPTPRNRVTWLPDQPGLEFRPPGVVFDGQPLPWSEGATRTGFTIELHLQAAAAPQKGVNHILTIHEEGKPSSLAICQWKSELVVRLPDRAGPWGYRDAGVGGLEPRPQMLTITGGPGGTTFYVDGRPMARYPGYIVPAVALRGGLILGDAAEGKHAWTGRILGVGILHRLLDGAEVARRHRAWMTRDEAVLAREPVPVVLFLFDEGAGDHALSRLVPAHRLEVPVNYSVRQKKPFSIPREWATLWRRDYRDLAVNLLGFVPFGFLVFHYRRLVRPHRLWAATACAVLAGGLLSVIIEVGQVWLPTRVSSATDLVLNTLGTALGVMAAVWINTSRP